MTGMYPPEAAPRRPAVDAGRLWAGGLATALVAALLAVVGILAARTLFDVAILAPTDPGTWGEASTSSYAFWAAAMSLLATGLIHLLILFTPRPMRFFAWLVGLATVVAVLAPFVADSGMASKLFTAGLNLVLGVAIGSLVAGTARAAMRAATVRPAPTRYR